MDGAYWIMRFDVTMRISNTVLIIFVITMLVVKLRKSAWK
jgi:hypothetical protein